MNLKILSLVIIGVCILLPDVCYAFLSKDVHLLNMQNGLADNTVSAVYKDKEGFVWFGTRNGLSRYDGRRITNFERSRSYPSISNLKEVFDGVLAFVDNGVFSAFDLKKERFLSVVSSSGQGIPSRGMLQRNDSLVWVISGSELHLMKRCASKEGELRLRVQEKYTGWNNQDNLLVAITYSSDKKSICLIDEKGRIILLDATNLNSFRVIDLGLVRHVLIRYGFTTKELMVCVIINGNSLPKVEKLIDRLTAIEGMKSISINQNTKKTNVILGDVTKCIWGDPYITDMIHLRDTKGFSLTDTAVAYHISPQSFYQVNPVQTEKLYSLALDYAGLTGKETVWDLYCGIGTISLFLAQKAGKVYGVEIVPQAIEDAKNNAALNGINNAEFFVGKAEEVLPAFYEKKKDTDADMLHPDVIVVDPPRKGCDGVCLEALFLVEIDEDIQLVADACVFRYGYLII